MSCFLETCTSSVASPIRFLITCKDPSPLIETSESPPGAYRPTPLPPNPLIPKVTFLAKFQRALAPTPPPFFDALNAPTALGPVPTPLGHGPVVAGETSATSPQGKMRSVN